MIIFTTPRVEATTSIGKTKYWIGYVDETDGVVSTYSEYWQDAGKHSQSAPVFPKGKQGCSDREQGIFEITADLQRKLDKGYAFRAGETAEIAVDQDRPPILPMLAHEYTKYWKDIVFPCYMQPKLNGIRAIFDPATRVFWTRQGNRVIAECVQHLADFAHESHNRIVAYALPREGHVLYDGELVLPAPHTFQETIAHVKKYRGDEAPKLEYHVFDCYDQQDPGAPFELRRRHLEWNFALGSRRYGEHRYVRIVPTTPVEDADYLTAGHTTILAHGYEGSMIRNAKAPYKAGHRSHDLLKLKPTEDAEYPIVGFTQGQGTDAGAIIYTCVTPDGKLFNVRPKGSIEGRQRAFALAEHDPRTAVGQLLTVKYQTLTDDGIPLFPVGLTLRNYE